MTDTRERTDSRPGAEPQDQPAAGWRLAAGLAAAAAAIGAGHGVAALVNPNASPLIAVGSSLIDVAPTPAKEFAVRTFGTADKPVLVTGIAVVLLLIAALLGLLAWRRRPVALTGIALLGAVGVLAATLRPGATPWDALPSVAAGLAGLVALDRVSRIGGRSRTAGSAPHPSRRALLAGIGATALTAAVLGGGGIVVSQLRLAGAEARRRLGLPSPGSRSAPVPAAAQVEGNTPFLTSIDDFYRVDIALVTPRIDPDQWSLTIDGLVDRPLTLSYRQLLELPMIERNITMTCVSNEVGGPYVGTASWLGVPFTEIIKRVGVQTGVDQVFSYSSDQGYTCSTPYQAVSDGRDAMIVVGMNGEVLPDKNGFPARMLVPGLYGFVSGTKWLERIEFTRYDRRTAYWTSRGWATQAPILTQSRIDVPKSLGMLSKDKPVLAGVAWAQHRGIERVEIRIDGGPWQQATLADEAGVDLWRQWSFVYRGPAGRHTAEVRATDKSGKTQPERRTKVFPSGARGWHQIRFTVE
ncbi:sulfite oxidase [Microlunatus panaciterrae]|uniref:DMSO/TMAO reductase YedYZ molybdopterin-dependent catalytic subunit n=1 Tax=Microlunatus panaciterrae TaxID=400768 RepID=A0ABS2RKB0_9ACTN|nr:DMSO/TMAO reductase YedYZ molybdopterin-dependent catalytic subunit [Microlunatus panaciterrae]